MAKIIPESINHVLKSAARRRAAVDSQRGKIFVYFILGDILGKAVKLKADDSNTAKIIFQGAFALSLQLDLLKKRFANSVESFDAKSCLFNNCR
jgi:hypothetical protein